MPPRRAGAKAAADGGRRRGRDREVDDSDRERRKRRRKRKKEKKMYFNVDVLSYNRRAVRGREVSVDRVYVRCRAVDTVARLAEKVWRRLQAGEVFLKYRMSTDRAFTKRSQSSMAVFGNVCSHGTLAKACTFCSVWVFYFESVCGQRCNVCEQCMGTFAARPRDQRTMLEASLIQG